MCRWQNSSPGHAAGRLLLALGVDPLIEVRTILSSLDRFSRLDFEMLSLAALQDIIDHRFAPHALPREFIKVLHDNASMRHASKASHSLPAVLTVTLHRLLEAQVRCHSAADI